MDDEGEQGERTCAASRVLQDYMSLDVLFLFWHMIVVCPWEGKTRWSFGVQIFQMFNFIMVRFDGSQHLHYCAVGGTWTWSVGVPNSFRIEGAQLSNICPCTDHASRLETIVRLLVVCERAALVTCLIISWKTFSWQKSCGLLLMTRVVLAFTGKNMPHESLYVWDFCFGQQSNRHSCENKMFHETFDFRDIVSRDIFHRFHYKM